MPSQPRYSVRISHFRTIAVKVVKSRQVDSGLCCHLGRGSRSVFQNCIDVIIDSVVPGSHLVVGVQRIFERHGVVRSRSRPETGRPVCTCRAEQVAQRMVFEGIYGSFVSVRNFVNCFYGRPRAGAGFVFDGIAFADESVEEVVAHGAVVGGGGYHRRVDRVPLDTRQVGILVANNQEIFHGPQVENTARSVAGYRRQEPAGACGLKPGFGDGVLVAVEGGNAVRSSRIPEFDQIILGARDYETHAGVPVRTLDVPVVPGKRPFFFSVIKIPNFHRRVVGSGQKFGVVGRKRNVSDCVAVAVDDVDVIEVGLPVFDRSGLISTQKPVVVVRILERQNRQIVCLHDSFKVECHSVPDGEFPGMGRYEKPSTLGRPLDSVD